MKCNKADRSHKNEKGIALVTILLFLTVMGFLCTSLVFTVQNEMKSSTAYKYNQQAFYVANAGVQKAVQWYRNTYTHYVPVGTNTPYTLTTLPVTYSGNTVMLAGQTGSSSVYPNSECISSFTTAFTNQSLQAGTGNTGTYAVNGTLLKYESKSFLNPVDFTSYTSSLERWRVESVGYWGSAANPLGVSRISAVIENSGNALFDRALWGIDSADLGGTVKVDSYDPALGAYNSTTNAGDNGSVGSNGTVTAAGSVQVHGDLAYGPSGSYSSSPNVTVSGDIFHLPQERIFPPIPNFTVGTTDVAPQNATITINPGSYRTFDIKANGILELTPGTYYVNSITQAATAALKITGNTTIYVKSGIDLTGQGVINPLGDPTQLTVYYSGTAEAKFVGGSQAYMEVYAPNAPVQLAGNADFYGSFIGRTLELTGTPQVHFSEGCLDNNLMERPFRVINWAQNSN
jgi:Tfp pilus assembly protein PilX